MTGYEELAHAIEDKDAEHGAETDEARNFAMRLVAQFVKHLGAPHSAIRLLPAEDVLRGNHEEHTLGEAVERDGSGYTLGLEIDFPRYVTGLRLHVARAGAGWKVSVPDTMITEVLPAQGEWKEFVAEVVDYLRHALLHHAPPDRVIFRSR